MYHKNVTNRTYLFWIVNFIFCTSPVFAMQSAQEILLENSHLEHYARRSLTTIERAQFWLKKISCFKCFEEVKFAKDFSTMLCDKIWPGEDREDSREKKAFREALEILIYKDLRRWGTAALRKNIKANSKENVDELSSLDEFIYKLRPLRLYFVDDNEELLANVRIFSQIYGQHDIYASMEDRISRAHDAKKDRTEKQFNEIPITEFHIKSQPYVVQKPLEEEPTLEHNEKVFLVPIPNKTHSEELFVRPLRF